MPPLLDHVRYKLRQVLGRDREVGPGQGPLNAAAAAPDKPLGLVYFPYAHDFTIENLTNNCPPAKTVFELLSPHIVHGAAHDSDECYYVPMCHEETRIAIRQDIVSWIKHGDGSGEPKNLMWLSGPAGAGKSAIAGSVAHECKEQGLLAATFFFSSSSVSADRMSKHGLIPTLAYYLSQHGSLNLFEAHLLKALGRRPDILHKNLKEQAECLILGPFRLIQRCSWVGWPKAIIIDGLDEVLATQHPDPTGRQPAGTSNDDQLEILNVLLALSRDPAFPFRILVISRPERHIANFFTTVAKGSIVELFLDSKYAPDADIERFLRSNFAQIRREFGISDPLWPGIPALRHIVSISSGQFIVPVTVMRWINSGVPQLQLDELLQLQKVAVGAKNPFASLDLLYRHILNRARNPDDDPRLVVKWISTIRYASSARATVPAQFWRHFLESVEGEFNYRMAPVTSLVSVPPPDEPNSRITFYHKSLHDFLSDGSRCGDLYVTETELNAFASARIVRVMKDKGPSLPLPLSTESLHDFLGHFLKLYLVGGIYMGHKGGSQSFFSFLNRGFDARMELTSCDVAWWADRILCGDDEEMGARQLGVMYYLVHRGMECETANVSPAPRHETTYAEGLPERRCHAACIHWRSGILIRARQLKWCVHTLEEVDSNGRLEDSILSFERALGALKKMGKQRDGSFFTCDACQNSSK